MRLLFLLLSPLYVFFQDKVMICKSGTAYAYHNHQCRGLKECTHTIESITLKEAISLRRTACEYCYGATSKPAVPSNEQCAAITKKGTQCSRKATSNGYCWQHGN